ncbi:hypothetical protein C8J36_103548 [Rhizobium sp. PP-F2F-G48]|uniref:hypothetical protein n=1 Tax=Rhizobium sp. PP-F2F-G48 TaxID=2135651 RepID=UPI0010497F48|nr:hypothetical protein [Rhizobium sp. PP-F2F-G48]TCM56178.1 hypothetical protein C8J36_103548 [Rhizobium sp. PP-F2F-G48]
MVKLPCITGTNHPCRNHAPCRGVLVALLGVFFLALMAAVPLATAGMARSAAFERAEARI